MIGAGRNNGGICTGAVVGAHDGAVVGAVVGAGSGRNKGGIVGIVGIVEAVMGVVGTSPHDRGRLEGVCRLVSLEPLPKMRARNAIVSLSTIG